MISLIMEKMEQNLRARLRRIKEMEGKRGNSVPAGAPPPASPPCSHAAPGWDAAGCQTVKRLVVLGLPEEFPQGFSPAMSILIPDFARYAALTGDIPRPEELLFFDLETTGLSGGAGTVAFLAAFGRLVSPGWDRAVPGNPRSGARKAPALEVTQYLLLDYPGEPDFLEAALGEFALPRGAGKPPLMVSYNGKTFDSQILKTRCLMNGREPPRYHHLDLLHPARRLWKRVLRDCSQGTIEGAVLGLDRSGDIPGSLAPDIWFNFLKTGETGDLWGICDHNLRDIQGLAVLLGAFSRIAGDPPGAAARYRCDPEALALLWHHADPAAAPPLLQAAAEKGSPLACRILALEAEWKQRDYGAALGWTERGLRAGGLQPGLREDLLRRRERLAAKEALKNAAGRFPAPLPAG
jgi:hypothetical protein